MKIDCYRDGGTVIIEDGDTTLYIEGRISATKKSKGAVFYDYPGDEDARKLSDLRNLMEAKVILEAALEESEYYLSTINKGIRWVNNKISDRMCPPEDFPCH